MDFIPKSNWQWVFDEQRSLLTLQIGDYIVDIIYKANMLVLPGTMPIPFTVDDVARYNQLFESRAFRDYQDEFSCNIILHILAIELFHKPIMPKSWLFADNEVQQTASQLLVDKASPRIDPMMHISLTAKDKHESAHYLVIEDEKEFVLCMLIDQIHQLTKRKSLPQFQIIKVTLDKLNLVKITNEDTLIPFQIA
jgi:cell division protein ZapC